MEALVTEIIAALSPSALPLVVVVVAALYFYYKLRELEKDRSNTKQQRDDDSQQVHDTLLKHGFEITNLKGIVDLHKDKLESIDKQLGIVNQELCKLNLQVEHLATALEKQNEIMLQQIQEKKK